jgi:3-oxoadipate enol-lactonase
MFVRDVPGPKGAPTVVLLHGWFASGGLNWFQAFEPLRRHYRVIAPDLRGHGRGIRSRAAFKLADCADDVAELLRVLDTGPAITVGYSMGGPVAQLLWRRHSNRVAGLVLCATSQAPVDRGRDSRVFGAMMAGAVKASRAVSMGTAAPRTMARWATLPFPSRRPRQLSRWALEEMRRHDFTTLFEAGQELARYDARRWIQRVDVPTSVVVTGRDAAVKPERQHDMAKKIPDATLHPFDGGHLACMDPEFGTTVLEACHCVQNRVTRAAQPRRRRASS